MQSYQSCLSRVTFVAFTQKVIHARGGVLRRTLQKSFATAASLSDIHHHPTIITQPSSSSSSESIIRDDELFFVQPPTKIKIRSDYSGNLPKKRIFRDEKGPCKHGKNLTSAASVSNTSKTLEQHIKRSRLRKLGVNWVNLNWVHSVTFLNGVNIPFSSLNSNRVLPDPKKKTAASHKLWAKSAGGQGPAQKFEER